MARNGVGHKKTIYCPNKNCNYKSRVFVASPFFNDKELNRKSSHSENCPQHQQKLISEWEKGLINIKKGTIIRERNLMLAIEILSQNVLIDEDKKKENIIKDLKNLISNAKLNSLSFGNYDVRYIM